VRRGASLLLLLLLAASSGAQKTEKWWEAYDRGVAAVNSGNFAAAAQALQKAINEMPNENATARGRGESFVYVPHFWLGIAKFNLRDVEGALREFRISEEQGVVQNTRYYGDLREWLSRVLIEKKKQLEAIAAEGKRESGAATKTAVSAQMQAMQAGGDRTDAYRSGQRKLQESRDVAAKAGTDLSEYRRAAEIAEQARVLFAAALDETNRQKAARAAASPPQPVVQRPVAMPATAPETAPLVTATVATVSAAAVQPITPADAAQPAASIAPQPAPTTSLSVIVADARVAVQQYRRQLRAAASERRGDARFQQWARDAARDAEAWQKTVSASPSDDAARKIVGQVSKAERDLAARLAVRERPAETTVTATARAAESQPSVEKAWRAYAAGDLRAADELLSRIISSTPSAEAYLLRGCSRYAQAMLSTNPELTAASSDLRKALSMNGALRLDPKSFSPKLVAFFEGLRKP
jgi:tetratricopeptide (TPR) repeat protein